MDPDADPDADPVTVIFVIDLKEKRPTKKKYFL
jgi:hypothetical protein